MWYSSFIPGFLFQGDNKNLKKLNEFENKIEAQNMFMQLLNLTLDTYKWNNLPDTCNSRFLEMMLIVNGWACLRNDSQYGLQSLGFLPRQFNIYGECTTGTAFGFFGGAMQCECFSEGSLNENIDTVYCRCNMANYPMINYIKIYSKRLSSLMRSMDTLSNQLKTPYFVRCEESQVNTVKEMLKKQQDNEIAIIGSKVLDGRIFEVLQTGVQGGNLEIMRNQYTEVMNMFLTLIGVANISNSTKRERMIVAEANSNNEIINDYLYEGLTQRKLFCEQCNKVFGTNISVEVNETREYTIENEKKPFADDKEADKNENV